jgi:predicted nuclease of predicted toxin-antitoxin system
VGDRVRFYSDENVPRAVTIGLRLRGVDILTAQVAAMAGRSDVDHLALALSQRRVVFTQDADFLRLHAGGVNHAGIVYAAQQSAVGELVRGLMLIVEVLHADEMERHVEFL